MTEASASQENNAQAENVGFGTKPYRTFVLSALTLIYILNFVDRGLLAVVDLAAFALGKNRQRLKLLRRLVSGHFYCLLLRAFSS